MKRRIRDIRFAITTTAGGAYTGTSTEQILGNVIAVDVNLSGLDATADTTLSVVSPASGGAGRNLLVLTNSQANTVYDLRGLGTDAAGASSAEYVYPFVQGTLKLVVAQGGSTKTGTVVVFVEE